MGNSSDGMNYAPKGKPNPVVEKGEFMIAAVALDHGHIYGMCNGLVEAGAVVKWVYDPDPEKVKAFQKAFPDAMAARSEEQVLEDPEVELVCGAAVTSKRCALGLRVMAAGKDYFTDKAPLTSLDQLAAAKKGGYAVGLFNVVSLEMLRGVFAAAKDTHSPLIVGCAEVMTKNISLEELIAVAKPLAEAADILLK